MRTANCNIVFTLLCCSVPLPGEVDHIAHTLLDRGSRFDQKNFPFPTKTYFLFFLTQSFIFSQQLRLHLSYKKNYTCTYLHITILIL